MGNNKRKRRRKGRDAYIGYDGERTAGIAYLIMFNDLERFASVLGLLILTSRMIITRVCMSESKIPRDHTRY